MFNSLKKTIDFLGLNYKTEITKIFLANLICLIGVATVIYFTRMYIIIIFGVLLIFGINYVFYFMYSSMKQNLVKQRADEFVHITSYFRIFIKNKNNVYQSFNKLLAYSSEWMKERIEAMLKSIDDDKSIKPYVDFADKFDFPIARNVMISIYQMVEEGETIEHLNQFTILFEQMSQTLNEERKDRKVRGFDIVNYFPLVGAGLITLALTFSMLTVVGDMINVI